MWARRVARRVLVLAIFENLLIVSAVLAGAWLRLGSFEWVTFTVEGGYAPWRQFDFHRTEVRYHNESGAPYGAVMLHGEF